MKHSGDWHWVTGETAAFEDLRGNHGGLGGPQTQPFLLSPSTLTVPNEQLVGAASIHRLLVGWLMELQAVGSPAGKTELHESPL